MKDSLLLTFVLTSLQIFSLNINAEYGCSVFCVCDIWYDLKRATCTNRRLYSIQIDISSVVEAIDLSSNSISSLSNYELAAASLSKLRYLNLSRNGINEIGLAAFGKLNDLAVLDLSRNHLNYISTDTFVTNLKLKIVKLQHNNFNLHVPKLRSSSITELDLSSCLISYLPVDAFEHLKKLNNVNLSKNVMIQLHMKALQRVPTLETISLEGNPWSCNRLMQETQNYLQSKKVKFAQFCESSTTGVKKFERMKLETPTSPPKKTFDIRLTFPDKSTELEEPWEMVKNNEDDNDENNDDDEIFKTLQALNTSRNYNLSSNMINSSPYWFIGIGFLLGSASTLIATYLWLYAAISCKLLRFSRETDLDRTNATSSSATSSSSQRISLLQNLWSQNDDQNDALSICPGTPPPPYREVMLHRSLYPSVR
ncbi:leucine-rich repeat-containing protein 19-like [Leptopilina heterotoma]|uniref:leucine-rich repeat-containing protein 19-like n=1 Tax=Leptopilina heterotoma TaxID=63436 RepID=UPI001CA8B5F9|nr:leucine-rich repeat-containing protein 19-like [Leptopilina heterotoma]